MLKIAENNALKFIKRVAIKKRTLYLSTLHTIGVGLITSFKRIVAQFHFTRDTIYIKEALLLCQMLQSQFHQFYHIITSIQKNFSKPTFTDFISQFSSRNLATLLHPNLKVHNPTDLLHSMQCSFANVIDGIVAQLVTILLLLFSRQYH